MFRKFLVRAQMFVNDNVDWNILENRRSLDLTLITFVYHTGSWFFNRIWKELVMEYILCFLFCEDEKTDRIIFAKHLGDIIYT